MVIEATYASEICGDVRGGIAEKPHGILPSLNGDGLRKNRVGS
jgi:hypothetical protein